MSDNAVATALHDGLDRLRERGWTQNRLCDMSTGAVCAVGALVNSTPANPHGEDCIYEPFQLLDEVARDQYPDRSKYGVVELNNHHDTTVEDVERVFEKAIVRAYEQEAGS